ncbi:hypothetical protein HanIR_Chr03g0130681 [Helianthus annuus]|nr:hypothetical protein HanIR_Chr03g0130681 [Helianthus annuus]
MASRSGDNPFRWSSDQVTIRLDCYLVWDGCVCVGRSNAARSDGDPFGEVILREQVHSSVVTRSGSLPIRWQSVGTSNALNMLKII